MQQATCKSRATSLWLGVQETATLKAAQHNRYPGQFMMILRLQTPFQQHNDPTTFTASDAQAQHKVTNNEQTAWKGSTWI
jgi:hypothetical protein